MIKPELVDPNIINLMKHNLKKCKINAKICKQHYLNNILKFVVISLLILFIFYKYKYKKTQDEKIIEKKTNQELLFKKIKEIQMTSTQPIKEVTDMITDIPIWK